MRVFNLFRKDLLKKLAAVEDNVISCIYWGNLDSDQLQLTYKNLSWHSLGGNHLSFNPISDIIPILRLIKLFVKKKPDALLAFNAKPIFFSSIIGRLTGGSVYSVALMEGLGNGFSFLAKNHLYDPLKFLFKRFTHHFKKWYFLNERDQGIIYHIHSSNFSSVVLKGIGVDIKHFSPPETSRQLYDNRKIIFVGRLLPEKGIFTFIEIAKKMKEIDQDWSFEIAGLSVKGSEIGQKNIKEWLQDGIISRCEFVSDMLSFYRSASILLFPSFYNEGFPVTIMEAQASGLPCLVANRSYLKNSILDGQSGFFVALSSLDNWIKKIEELSEYKTYASFSLCSRKHAEQNFDQNIPNEMIASSLLRGK